MKDVDVTACVRVVSESLIPSKSFEETAYLSAPAEVLCALRLSRGLVRRFLESQLGTSIPDGEIGYQIEDDQV